jgi:bacteriorhodopsin
MTSALIVQIAVIGAFVLMGLGILSMIFSGVRGIAQGKQDFKRIALISTPVIIFAISYLATNDVTKAGVLTTMGMMVIMIVSIVITGLRGTFKF